MAFQLSPPLEEVGSLIWGFLARPRLSPAPETQNSGRDAELEKSKMKRKSLCPEEAGASEEWSKEGRQASYQELQASERGTQGAGGGLIVTLPRGPRVLSIPGVIACTLCGAGADARVPFSSLCSERS